MKLKRTICLVLAIVCVVALGFVGCGQDNTPAGNDQPVKSDNPTPQKSDDPAPASSTGYNWDLPSKQVQLLWYVIGSTEQKDQELVQNKANEYLADKINATLKIVFMDYGDYMEVMGTKFAAGEPIDVAFTSGWAGAAGFRKNAADGNFLALNDYLKDGGILSGTAEILGDSFLGATRIDGINYAIPCNKEKAHNWGFLFRKDIVDELNLNIDSVKTVEDLEPILGKVKSAHPEMIPLVTATGEACWRLLDWNTISDDDVPGALYPDNRDNKIINQYAAPESKAFYNTMRKYYEAGYVRADADTASSWQDDINSGMGFCVSQSMKPGKDIEFSQGKSYTFVGVDATRPVMSNREADGSMMCIPVNSKNPDRAAMLLEIANTDKYFNNLLNFGIEGTHFTKVAGKENIIDLSADNAGWRPNVTWVFPNQFMNYVMSSEDPEKFVKFEQYNASALPLNNLGFVFNGTDPQIDSIIATCKEITNQYTPRLFSGSTDPEATLAEMVKKQDAAKVDVLIAEMQKQYDAWLASK